MKRLRKAVRDYLTMRRGLGFKMARHEVGLEDFVSFLERKRSSHITVKLALEWATQHPHHTPGELGHATHCSARLRPALECDRSLNGSSATRSSAVSAAACATIFLFPSRNQKTAERGQNAPLH